MWLLLAVGVAGAALGLILLVRHRHQQMVTIRGGLIEVEYTTVDASRQQAAARRCGLDDGEPRTAAHIRYVATPRQEREVGDCLLRSGIVRVIGIPG